MRTQWRIGILGILLCVFSFFPLAIGQAALNEIVITNVLQRENDVFIYFDAIDVYGNSVEGLSEDMLMLSVGPNAVKVEKLQAVTDLDEGIAYIMLLDTSYPLRTSNRNLLDKALSSWVEALGTGDKMAIVSYGATTEILTEEFITDKDMLDTLIRSLKYAEGKTYLYDGLKIAAQFASRKSASLPDKIVMVLYTDGKDDGSTTATMEEAAALLSQQGIPLYVVGYGSDAAAINALGQHVRATRGAMVGAVSDGTVGLNIEEVYRQIQNRISSGYRLAFSVEAYPFDGSVYPIMLNVNDHSDMVKATASAALTTPGGMVEETSVADFSTQDATAQTTQGITLSDAGVSAAEGLGGRFISTFNEYADRLLEIWRQLSAREQLMAAILGGIISLLFILLVALLVASRRRKKRARRNVKRMEAKRYTTDQQEAVQPARYTTAPLSPPLQVPPASLPVSPAADTDYDRTLFSPQPANDFAGEYDRTTAVSFDPSIQVAFQITTPADTSEKTHSVSKRFIIGRLSSCELQIKDSSISQRHAELCFTDNRLTIRDLQSTNGVFVNGVKTTSAFTLRSGDTIQMGNISVRVNYHQRASQ